MTSEKDDFAKLPDLQNKQRDVSLSNMALLILQEIWKVVHFWCQEILKSKVANGRSQRIEYILAEKRNSGTRFGHFFITSSSSHFFDKTDFEQYLVKSKKQKFDMACDSNILINQFLSGKSVCTETVDFNSIPGRVEP